MELSQVVINISKCNKYISMLEGLKYMLDNPDITKDISKKDRRGMMLDIVNFGIKLSEDFKKFNGSNEYLQTMNFALEGLLEIEKRKVEEIEININRLKKGLKEFNVN